MQKTMKSLIVILLATVLVLCMAACSTKTDIPADTNDLPESNKTEIEGGVNNSPVNINDPANAEGRTYIATFVTDGSPVAQMDVRVIEEPPTTVHESLVFAGWYLSPELTEESKVVFPYELLESTKFYAKWTTSGIKDIYTIDDLKSISMAMDGSYRLMRSLDLRSVDWIPLGMSFTKTPGKDTVTLDKAVIPFTGTFINDGDFIISNLTLIPIAEEEKYNYLPYGLFSVLGEGGIIEGIRLSSYRIHLDASFSDFLLGSLVGLMQGGVIRDCNVTGSINNPELVYEGSIWDEFLGSYADPTSDTFIGGLVGGIREGLIERCYSSGKIVSESVADGVFVGGLAGFNWNATVRDCASSATVQGFYAGGLIGYNNRLITDCLATGSVSGSRSYPAVAGGLVAYNDINGVIERSYSSGDVVARTAGGLVGINMFNYSKNQPLNIAGDPVLSAVGETTDANGNSIISIGSGGILRNCYSTSNVSANEYAGGLIGRTEAMMPVNGKSDLKPEIDNNFYFIINCFAYGNVKAIAEEIAYKDENGRYLITTGVYHSVYAGGLIGHAMEARVKGCVAFGSVSATSRRPTISGGEIFNIAYADNVIGQSSNQQGLLLGYYFVPIKDVYAVQNQTVLRNGSSFSEFNSSEGLPFYGNEGRNLNSADFFIGIGFSATIWNFNNINIEEGRIPGLI